MNSLQLGVNLDKSFFFLHKTYRLEQQFTAFTIETAFFGQKLSELGFFPSNLFL